MHCTCSLILQTLQNCYGNLFSSVNMISLKPFFCTYCGIWKSSLDSKRRHILRHQDKYQKVQPIQIMQLQCETLEADVKQASYFVKEFNPVVLQSELQASNCHPHKCMICKSWFPSFQHLKHHTKIHSKVKDFECEYCQKCFTSQNHLLGHIKRTHTKEKPYPCGFCGKRFTSNESLNHHVKVHTKEKPYQSGFSHKQLSLKRKVDKRIGHKQLSLKSKLDKRIGNTHTKRTEFKCEHCQKSFSSKSVLTVYIRTHTKEKPYQCEYCGKSCSQLSNLKLHIRIHTKERPYQCEHCEKCFIDSNKLKDHIRSHTKERPFCCDFCGKSFSQRRNLKLHIRTHTKEKPYKCDYCEKGFNSKWQSESSH